MNLILKKIILSYLKISTNIKFKPTKTFNFSSTIQAELDNAYGKSKLKAENEFLSIPKNSNQKFSIYRLPGVFGKWSSQIIIHLLQ